MLASDGAAQQKEIVVGQMCDRTGPTQINGVVLCPAGHDYYDLINSKGGVEGYSDQSHGDRPRVQGPAGGRGLSAPEGGRRRLDDGLRHPAGAGAQPEATGRQDSGTSPGFGIAASADGKRFPYLFPIAATYWSQGAGAIQFVKDKLGGSLEGKKIAYVFYDNPAGREPLPVIEDLQKLEKFELRTFAVPPPGVEIGAQVLDITQRYRPDFVIAHLFGRAPSVALKEFKRAGYPLSKMIGLVWASAEADILAAGGWPVAEGYHTLQFAGAGDDYPVRQEIKAMYKAQGKEPPKEMDDTVVYNRGILWAAVHVEAIRNALKATGGKKPTGEDVKKGFESIHDFTLGGLVPPLKLSAGDHEGGGWVQVFQVKCRQVRQGNGVVPRLPGGRLCGDRQG